MYFGDDAVMSSRAYRPAAKTHQRRTLSFEQCFFAAALYFKMKRLTHHLCRKLALGTERDATAFLPTGRVRKRWHSIFPSTSSHSCPIVSADAFVRECLFSLRQQRTPYFRQSHCRPMNERLNSPHHPLINRRGRNL